MRSTPAPAAPTDGAPAGLSVLVGGVGELFQGDLDIGRRVAERLAVERLGPGVAVEDLSYGAVAVVQRLQELRPRTLVLVGAARRGRAPGEVQVTEVAPPALSNAQLQAAVADAVTGYVTIDLLVEVAAALGALPARVVAVELEPVLTEASEALSPAGEAALERLVALAGDAARSAAERHRDQGADMTEHQDDGGHEGAGRKTEQGDPLPDEHSLAQQEGGKETPYHPPRQPVQDQPGEDSDAEEPERGIR